MELLISYEKAFGILFAKYIYSIKDSQKRMRLIFYETDESSLVVVRS